MIYNRYSNLPLPKEATNLCPYGNRNEQAVWNDAVRAVTIFEAARGAGSIILHRLRKAWREGDRIVNLGMVGARLPKYQCAIVYRLLEIDGFVQPVERLTYDGAGGRPTIGLELLKTPPPASEYLREVCEVLRGSTVQQSLLPELEVIESEGDEEALPRSPLLNPLAV